MRIPGPIPRGLSLLEVVMADSLLGIMMMGIFAAVNISSRAYALNTIQGDINSSCRKATDEMVSLLTSSGAETLLENPEALKDGSDVLTFKRNIGYDPVAKTRLWSNLYRFRVEDNLLAVRENVGLPGETVTFPVAGVAPSPYLEGESPGNGVDDNGNGVKDEKGLFFVLDGNKLTIYLTMEKFDARRNQLYQSSLTTTVHLRNY